jgi:fructokinase
MSASLSIGIDFGGTKIEAAALDASGIPVVRRRVATPDNYAAALLAVQELVRTLETETGVTVSRIGVGAPGSVSPRTGLLRNANTQYLNGQLFGEDLARTLGKAVRTSNDANCLALSEASDGAAAGARVVFAAILGTGCGGGLVVDGRLIDGANGIGGEWGHNPLPWPDEQELREAPRCWCGQRGCLENWISGSGLQRDFFVTDGKTASGEEIVAAARAGDPASTAALERYINRLGRALASVINLVDPDVIVLGGGMSNVDEIFEILPTRVRPYVFSDIWESPIRRARWGDSSGVRGAARLWDESLRES